MSLHVPTCLLRLREGDVVRLCGLVAAARGLALLSAAPLKQGERSGARLSAVMAGGADAAMPVEVSLALDEAANEAAAISGRWCCSLHAKSATSTIATLACEHVAALLTAWIRFPDIFRDVTPQPLAQEARSPSVPRSTGRPAAAVSSGRASRPPAAASTLAAAVARLPMPVVRETLTQLGDAALSEADGALRSLLARALLDHPTLARHVAALDPPARALLTSALLHGGILTQGDLESYAARTGLAKGTQTAIIRSLERASLVLAMEGATRPSEEGHEQQEHALTGWRIPRELLPLLPSAALLNDGGEHAPEGCATEHPGPRPLVLALALLAAAPSVGAAPAPPAARPRSQVLIPGDLSTAQSAELGRATGVAPGIVRLARRLLHLAEQVERTTPVARIAAIPAEARPAALQAAFALWRDACVPYELADLDASAAPLSVRLRLDASHFSADALAAEVAQARQVVVRLMALLSPGAWYDVDALVALLWRAHPLFLRGRQLTYALPAWTFEQTHTGRILRPGSRRDWEQAEGMFIRHLLAGPLAWFGIVELARPAEGPVRAVRITPFGAACLDDQPLPPAIGERALPCGSEGAAVLLRPDGTLAVQPLAAGAHLLEALGRWTRVTGIADGRLRLALSAEAAADAFDAGQRFEAMIPLLRGADTAHEAAVAQAVEAQLSAWQRAHGRSTLAIGWALLSGADEASLREALAYVPEIAARCQTLSSHDVLVPEADVPALAAALARRGYAL